MSTTTTSAPTYTIPQATGGCVEAPVLVTSEPFSARYDLNRVSGVFSREGHPLKGIPVAGKILVSPGVQGGVAAGWALPSMARNGVGFAGLLFGVTNPVMVQGAVTAGIPIGAGISTELLEELRTGDVIRFDADNHTVTIVSRAYEGTDVDE